jgi:hypothetical protein
VLRAGRLMSRSGSHCLPLSWLVRRPTAFTDEPYDLSLHPPIRLERRRRLVSALVRAGEAAALRAGTRPLPCPRLRYVASQFPLI